MHVWPSCHSGTLKYGVTDMEHEMKTSTGKSDYFDIDIQSCSAMDCTGLIPALPQSDAEMEHYNQLYHFLPGYTDDPKARG